MYENLLNKVIGLCLLPFAEGLNWFDAPDERVIRRRGLSSHE